MVCTYQLKRAEEEEHLGLKETVEARRRADELMERATREKWKLEDEELRLKKQLELDRAEKVHCRESRSPSPSSSP